MAKKLPTYSMHVVNKPSTPHAVGNAGGRDWGRRSVKQDEAADKQNQQGVITIPTGRRGGIPSVS